MRIAVTSKSFSKNTVLIDKLKNNFDDIKLNTSDRLLSVAETIEFLSDCDGAIVALEKIDAQILQACPRLKIIAKYGVGLDNINLEDCKRFGVRVGWTGGVNKSSVAEMALGFMLMLCRNLYTTSNELKQGGWNKNGGHSLFGKTVGIIGLGNIGKELVRLLAPFRCNILANDIADQSLFAKEHSITMVTKEELFQKSDVVTIHTPLTELTKNLINSKTLGMMQDCAFVINTARGGLVNLQDLELALKNKTIAGAAIDVYDVEPPTEQGLIGLPNLICTPHIGGNSIEAVIAMGESAIGHLVEYKEI
jgi:phosphoglycerate dehydrogenase-like enzyme